MPISLVKKVCHGSTAVIGNVSGGDDSGRGTGYAINGQRSASTNVLLDGGANNDQLTLSAGVDNLFDRAYAEHLSRAGSMVAGFVPETIRVSLPPAT